ncbi:uncharacterized protein LOC124929758 [Impatiens glandulifera]|uniref:uncharacterized protein LOC124929758 n=1 Tax=Impatiens glandulifera TaxID=253017 RepID=UPI001FB0F98C|nr:uncharacterized protein LOC124929758 [Impatiens glandulifera]
MKDLIRWATTAKYQKGGKYFGRKVLQLRNKAAALRSIPDEGELNWSNDSPKISFRWDVESCSSSTISMASSSSSLGVHDLFLSALHPSNHTKGNWITTDSEFVVLEL